MDNIEIREAIKESGFKHWQIADMIGVADTTFCRMLRRELPDGKKFYQQFRQRKGGSHGNRIGI